MESDVCWLGPDPDTVSQITGSCAADLIDPPLDSAVPVSFHKLRSRLIELGQHRHFLDF